MNYEEDLDQLMDQIYENVGDQDYVRRILLEFSNRAYAEGLQDGAAYAGGSWVEEEDE